MPAAPSRLSPPRTTNQNDPNFVFIFTEKPIAPKLSARLSLTGTTFTNAYSQGAWNDDFYSCASTMFKTASFLWNSKSKNESPSSNSKLNTWPRIFSNCNYNLGIDETWPLQNDKPFFILLTSDRSLGTILDTLQTKPRLQSTYVFYSSTNITNSNNYDITQPLPLIAAGPNITPKRLIDTPVYIQDIVPTTYALSNINTPEDIPYKSLLPALYGQYHQPHDALYFAFKESRRVVIKDDYKLDLFLHDQTAYLYNLADDPLSPKNIIDDPTNKNLRDKLLRKLFDLQKQTGDQFYLRGIYAHLLHCPIC